MKLPSAWSQRLASIRFRLIAAVIGVHAVLMVVFVADLVHRQQALLLDNQLERSRFLAESLSRAAAPWLASNDYAGLQELVEVQAGEADLLFAAILDDQGQVLAHTDKSKRGKYFENFQLPQAPQVITLSSALVDSAAPVQLAKHTIGAAWVGLGQETNRQRWQSVVLSGTAYALTAILCGAVLAWLMARRMVRQLADLQAVADAVRNGDDQRRAPVAGGDEIATLSKEFNLMLDRIDEQRRELDRHRSTLEQRVAERTGELLHAKEAAESAARAKSTFLANMSHEIRTPLNAVLGLVHLVKAQGVAPKQADQLTKVEKAGRHLLEILNNILDLSRIEADSLPIEKRDFALNEVVYTATAASGVAAAAKGLELTVAMDGVPTQLRGDPLRLSQMLVNYLGNAIKFTEKGRIELRGQLVDQTETAYRVRFEVTDTGIGVEASEIERLFHPFEQADNSTTRRFGGTGLGLAINRRLAALMGGEVGADSERGRGSTFWIEVWLDRPQAPVALSYAVRFEEPFLRLKQTYAGAQVLLVEDDELNLEVARDMLLTAGLVVTTAAGGAEAVSLAASHPFDTILMDIQMSDLDGLEATRRIRQLPQGAAVPIVALTANAFAEDRARVLAAGMDDFVAKPIEPEQLCQVLAQQFERRRRAS